MQIRQWLNRLRLMKEVLGQTSVKSFLGPRFITELHDAGVGVRQAKGGSDRPSFLRITPASS